MKNKTVQKVVDKTQLKFQSKTEPQMHNKAGLRLRDKMANRGICGLRRGKMAFAAGVAAAFLCTGCGGTLDGSGGSVTSGNYVENSATSSMLAGGSIYSDDSFVTSEVNMGTGNNSEGMGVISDARKMITNVRLELETKEFEQTMSGIETQVRDMGGYIESMETYNGSSYTGNRASRYSNMTIRVPAAKLEGFMDTVSEAGNIVKRNDDVKDVTLSYVDMESRRDTLRTEQSRLLEFLERADSVETVIALEERLSEVRYQLESMESQLRTIDNLVDYSTVDMKITEVKELTPAAEQTVWERIESGFAESLYDIGDGIIDAGVWFAVNIPYFVIWAVVIITVVVILRKSRQKHCQKKEKRQAAQMREGKEESQIKEGQEETKS